MNDETNEVRETRSRMIPQETLARRGLPPYCYVLHPSTGEMVMVKRGEMGYTKFPDSAVATQTVDELNHVIGVSPAQREAMLAGSVFGFHVPGANPEWYK